MLDFKKFLQEHSDYASAAVVSNEKQGPITGNPLLDLIIPKVNKTSRIEYVDRNSKSHSKLITVLLADNTKIFFNWDEFRRIQGSEPEKGKMLSVVFQRSPTDRSNTPSKIISATCY